MRINNNLMAMNTHRQLALNNSGGAKSIEKLSSGYRINRAGDDAAGLAISEKMRGQIRGLTQASRNAQDDISLIQTTEGALGETHAIIQRMREMAVQSSNDTNTDEDRTALQNEMDQLAQEITRIANNTEFNTRKLLNGNLDNATANATGDITFHIGANTDQNMQFGVKAMDAKSLGLTEDRYTAAASGAQISAGKVSRVEQGAGLVAAATAKVDAEQEITITSAADAKNAGKNAKAAAVEISQDKAAGTSGTIAVDFGVTGEKYNDITIKFVAGAAATPSAGDATFDEQTNTITLKLSGTAAENTKAGIDAALKGITAVEGYDFSKMSATVTGTIDSSKLTGDALKLAGGEDAMYNVKAAGEVDGKKYEETVSVKESATSVTFGDAFKGVSFTTKDAREADQGKINASVDKAGVAEFNVDHSLQSEATVEYGINILSQKSANIAIDRIDSALKAVSDERAKLGAVQNRLEHTIKNVDTSAENLQASESRIRDVDMAQEMMNYTKNNILQQAAQAMLAQANQAPQGVLQLLR